MVEAIRLALERFDARSALDIAIIALIVYGLLLLIRGTTAMTLLRGILVIYVFAWVLGNTFELTMLSWLLRNSFPALLVVIPVIFQPELRRALERIGRSAVLRRWVATPSADETITLVSEATCALSRRGHGAIIVLERRTGLQDYIDSGVKLDAAASVELLTGVFYPNSPLHDGAVVLRDTRVAAARCLLPLSDNMRIAASMGTRHRAALGITERTDAISVVVSEQTGAISVASGGRIITRLDENTLHHVLALLYKRERGRPLGEMHWWGPRERTPVGEK
jgi:diadenylate cyclase